MNSKTWLWAGIGALAIIAGSFAFFHRSDTPDPAQGDVGNASELPASGSTRETAVNVTLAPDAVDIAAPDIDSVPVFAEEQETTVGSEASAPVNAEPLPDLAESDQAVLNDATPLFGSAGVPGFLIPDALIEHIVVTVENLEREPIRLGLRPTRHVPGQPVVRSSGADEPLKFLVAGNAERYAPFVRVLQALDPARAAALFNRYEPLFQQAYSEMGYPRQQFRDRLLAVIDHLLQAPEVGFPIRVVQPKVFYEFADPALEELSWGQKVLIRMGPKNRAVTKEFLRGLRDALN